MLEKYNKMSIAARAAFWAMAAGVIQKGISVLATPVFTRILTTQEYAQYTLYQSWHDLFIIFTSLYIFNYAIYTAMIKFEDDRAGFVASAQMLITILTLVCFIIYAALQFLCGGEIGFPISIVILMFLDLLFVSAFNLWAAKERYVFNYRLMTTLSVLIGVLGTALGLIATHFAADKGYGRIYGAAIANIVFGLALYVYNFSKSNKLFVLEYWKFILLFCVPLIPHFLSAQILTRFDRIMINDMCGASEAGIYSLAYSLSMLMSIVSDAVLKSFTPWTYQRLKAGKKENLKKVTNVILVMIGGANLILVLFAPEALRIFAPEDYYEAIYIIPAVSASVYFTFLYNVFANIEYYYSETKFMAFASIAAAIVNILLNYLFIPLFGFTAAGYTTLVSYILYALGHYLFMQKVIRKHADGIQFYDNKFIFRFSLLLLVFVIFVSRIYNHVLVRYLVITILITAIIGKRKYLLNNLRTLKKGEKV